MAAFVGAFYYLRVVRAMYFSEPTAADVALPGGAATALVSVNALAILALGAFPSAIMALCVRALQG